MQIVFSWQFVERHELCFSFFSTAFLLNHTSVLCTYHDQKRSSESEMMRWIGKSCRSLIYTFFAYDSSSFITHGNVWEIAKMFCFDTEWRKKLFYQDFHHICMYTGLEKVSRLPVCFYHCSVSCIRWWTFIVYISFAPLIGSTMG